MFYFRSKIQGLGLCAARDLEKHTMVIEYIGEVIRGELSEKREKDYESKVSLNFSYLNKKKCGNKKVTSGPSLASSIVIRARKLIERAST